MDLEPLEALDVDDSDLSTFLRPCKRRNRSPSSPSSLIPGPAGAVQAAMMNRSRDHPLPTQEFLRRVGHQSDLDFNTSPWLSAMQFLRSLSQGTVDADDVAPSTPLSSVKKHPKSERVDQVVAVVKSCTPNGFGDMMVTLKDPTSTVNATIHRKVFSEGAFRNAITAGSVLVLRKAAVFSPTPSTSYLNITLQNIVKVFSKDSEPPSQHQSCPARPVIRSTPIIERREESGMLGTRFSLPPERAEGVMYNLRLDSRFSQVTDNGRQREEILTLTSCHSDNGNDQNQKTVLNRESLLSSQNNARLVAVTCSGGEMEDQPNLPKLDEGVSQTGIAQGDSSTKNSVHDQETGMENHLEGQKQMVTPKSSIPHWTEEQLDELLAFD